MDIGLPRSVDAHQTYIGSAEQVDVSFRSFNIAVIHHNEWIVRKSGILVRLGQTPPPIGELHLERKGSQDPASGRTDLGVAEDYIRYAKKTSRLLSFPAEPIDVTKCPVELMAPQSCIGQFGFCVKRAH